MDDLLLFTQVKSPQISKPCNRCHSGSRSQESLTPNFSDLQFKDAFSRRTSDGLQFKALSPSEQKKSKEQLTRFLGTFGDESDLLEKATVFEINPADYEENHPLALLQKEFVKEFAPGKSSHNHKVTISFGDDYWTSEDRQFGKDGSVISSLAAIPVGTASAKAGAAIALSTGLATGAGVVSGIIVTASGAIIAVAVVAGVSYLIHLGIKAADESSIDVTPYTASMDLANFKSGDMPDISAVSVTKKDDHVVPYANQAQTLLYVLDEDGMLREIESSVKHGKVFPFLSGDQFDLDVTGQRSINDAWKQLTHEVKKANQEQGEKTKYQEVLYEGMEFGGEPYSWFTSREVIDLKMPVVPAHLNTGLENFEVSVTDADGNRVNSHEAERVLRSLDFKGRNSETGRKEYDVNPVYQLVVANRLRQAMMVVKDKDEKSYLANFAAKHLYSMKDRSFHAAGKDIDEMDPNTQQYDKLYEHVRILYEDALNSMRKKEAESNGSQIQPHLKVLSDSIQVARDYSNGVNAKVYGEAYSELNLEKGSRVLSEYGYESFNSMFDQNKFTDFKAWAQRNEAKFLKFVKSNEEMVDSLGLNGDQSSVKDLSDEQLAKVFLSVKDKIASNQRAKTRTLVNLVDWLEKDTELLKNAPANLMTDLKEHGIEGLNKEQLDFLIETTANKRESVLREVVANIEEKGPSEVNGKFKHSLMYSGNLAKTVTEALYELRYIDDETRDKGGFLESNEIEAIIKADREKTSGFEGKVATAWLNSNQNGNADTLDQGKLEDLLFSYIDIVTKSDGLDNKDKKSDIVLGLSDYIAEDLTRLRMFQAVGPNSTTEVDDFKNWLIKNNIVEMPDTSNSSINQLRQEITSTLKFIQENASQNPFNSGLLAQIRR